MLNDLYSITEKQKLGLPNGAGHVICGVSLYGDYNDKSAIYRNRIFRKKRYQEKMQFYPYVITHTVPQQANRTKFATAISTWQGMTSSQKAKYNRLALKRQMSGYNLFIRYYMMS